MDMAEHGCGNDIRGRMGVMARLFEITRWRGVYIPHNQRHIYGSQLNFRLVSHSAATYTLRVSLPEMLADPICASVVGESKRLTG